MNPGKYKKLSENLGLSHKQQQAVAELLKPSNKSYEDVTRVLGISSRCLYNWRKNPKFKKALENGLNELKQRVLLAAEFSVQLDSMNSMLDYEAKVRDAIDVREAIIRMAENQENIRVKLETFREQIEHLRTLVDPILE